MVDFCSQILLPLKTAPKHIVLPPFAKPGQFQYTPLRGTVFQKSRSLQLSIPGHSLASIIPQKSGWLAGLLKLHQICHCLLQSDPSLGG